MESAFASPLEGFYVSGGTVPLESPSYVERSADASLFEALSAGKFCYVLNSRQMGKSSLCVRTMARLDAAGTRSAFVDLTKIGGRNVTPDQWYAGLVVGPSSRSACESSPPAGPHQMRSARLLRFGDHLKRILVAVSQLPEVLAALRESLENPQLRDADGFHRLVSGGVMYQSGDNRIASCELYRRYFKIHLSK